MCSTDAKNTLLPYRETMKIEEDMRNDPGAKQKWEEQAASNAIGASEEE